MALIPLSSHSDAQKAVLEAEETSRPGPAEPEAGASDNEWSDGKDSHAGGTTTSEDGHGSPATTSPADEGHVIARPQLPRRGSSNVAQDVIEKKGQYGRFAERWFSRKGWTAERRRAQGMSVHDEPRLSDLGAASAGQREQRPVSDISIEKVEGNEGAAVAEQRVRATNPKKAKSAYTLLPKLLRTTKLLLSSKSFFFSYELDITRRLGTKAATATDVPLHKAVDPLVTIVSPLFCEIIGLRLNL